MFDVHQCNEYPSPLHLEFPGVAAAELAAYVLKFARVAGPFNALSTKVLLEECVGTV
jgi:hypothetical protein